MHVSAYFRTCGLVCVLVWMSAVNVCTCVLVCACCVYVCFVCVHVFVYMHVCVYTQAYTNLCIFSRVLCVCVCVYVCVAECGLVAAPRVAFYDTQ